MAKEKTHLAIVTKNGVPEAMFLAYLEKNPAFKKEWIARSEKSYMTTTFEEMTEKEVEKETERYSIYYEKEKEKRRKEIDILKEEFLKKKTSKNDFEELPPRKAEVKKSEESEESEESEDTSEKKSRKRTIIKTRRK